MTVLQVNSSSFSCETHVETIYLESINTLASPLIMQVFLYQVKQKPRHHKCPQPKYKEGHPYSDYLSYISEYLFIKRAKATVFKHADKFKFV